MELLTVKEVAKKLTMSEVTIRRWIKNGKLEAIKIGKSYRIKKKDLKDFVESSPRSPIDKNEKMEGEKENE